MALLLFLAAFSSSSPSPVSRDTCCILYLVSEPTPVRSAPAATARPVAKLKPFDIVIGRELVGGWLQVEAASAGVETGWIPLTDENVITVPIDTLKRRIFRVQRTRWPERVKVDIARGRIRHGFTADQVQLALGDPLAKELVHTGPTIGEAWTYEDRRIMFSHAGVRAIENLDQR